MILTTKNKRILCIYASRQFDSNMLMSSTVFNGLHLAGCQVEMLFCGSRDVYRSFKEKYHHYFAKIYFVEISGITRYNFRSEKLKVLHSFYTQYIHDIIKRPYRIKDIAFLQQENYDILLSFLPPVISGLFAEDFRNAFQFQDTPWIQFWTDPFSLGRCNDASEIPWWRFLHKSLERRILRDADKVVFCHPILCEMEQKLYPEFSSKMSWSDISYIEHSSLYKKSHNHKITVGLFGAYQNRVRNIRPLLSVLALFPQIQFIIRGDSDCMIDINQYQNLDVKQGRVPAPEVEQLEAQCDILLSLNAVSGFMTPGKLYYYASYDKPIIHIGDGVHQKTFAAFLAGFQDRYIVCENNKESIKLAIDKAISELPNFKLKIPARMDPVNIAKKIIDLAN